MVRAGGERVTQVSHVTTADKMLTGQDRHSSHMDFLEDFQTVSAIMERDKQCF